MASLKLSAFVNGDKNLEHEALEWICYLLTKYSDYSESPKYFQC